jgi:hypothetical protein
LAPGDDQHLDVEKLDIAGLGAGNLDITLKMFSWSNAPGAYLIKP